ncbi:MAG: 16S rRNA (uracil(1498)-N(3))-methyltransferase [Anaerolineae bacterium]|nr:16S rRNA (uracil(1498)-N(3))-methyltransferase [Anaerolineae bacterium]
MHRFFIPQACLNGDFVRFPAHVSRQMERVLRLKPGQSVAVVCPEVNEHVEYRVELVEVAAGNVTGVVRMVEPLHSEPDVKLTLYLSLAQREKFEWMLQKCTEAGAAGFVPTISARSLVQEGSETEKKLERWKKILQEAAEQSGRGRIPGLSPSLRFDKALTEAGNRNDLILLAWEGEKDRALRQVRQRFNDTDSWPERIAIFIGPEGGFTDQEAAQAVSSGAIPFSLGARILRMETAAVAATVLVLYEFDRGAQSSGGGAAGP